MTIKIQVFGTALVTLSLAVAAMWANGIPPVGVSLAACLDEGRVVSATEAPALALGAAQASCAQASAAKHPAAR